MGARYLIGGAVLPLIDGGSMRVMESRLSSVVLLTLVAASLVSLHADAHMVEESLDAPLITELSAGGAEVEALVEVSEEKFVDKEASHKYIKDFKAASKAVEEKQSEVDKAEAKVRKHPEHKPTLIRKKNELAKIKRRRGECEACDKHDERVIKTNRRKASKTISKQTKAVKKTEQKVEKAKAKVDKLIAAGARRNTVAKAEVQAKKTEVKVEKQKVEIKKAQVQKAVVKAAAAVTPKAIVAAKKAVLVKSLKRKGLSSRPQSRRRK